MEQRLLVNPATETKKRVGDPEPEGGRHGLAGRRAVAPLQWPIGWVTAVFPGNAGHVRAVNVRTEKGEYKRPAYKARKLPTDLFVDSNLVTIVPR